jgi:hypothetical protein
MADKPHVLFVLFEGLADTVIDSQVLLHARALRDGGLADFTIWTFAWNDALYRRSMERLPAAMERAGCPIRVLRGLRPGLPGSRLINGALVRRAWRRFRPPADLVHARTDYVAACCAEARLPVPILWDCRGDALAELEAALGDRPAPLRALRLAMARRSRRRAAETCAGAICVSHPLAALVRPEMRTDRLEVIPCGASRRLFFFDPALRAERRAALGLGDGQEVYVYSGGLAAYQCFGQTLDLFAARLRRQPGAHLLLLTPAVDRARQEVAARALPEAAVTLRKAAIEEVNGFLNAADCAFMLRQDSPINAAAAPTKFAEYALAGLPVVMTEAVRDAAALARAHGILVPPAEDAAWTLPRHDRPAVAAALAEGLSKEAQIAAYRRLYAGLAGAPEA